MAQEFEIIVDETALIMRLDAWLATKLGGDFSRARLQKLIREGAMTIDGQVVTEPRHKVRFGQKIIIALPPAAEPEPEAENIALDILYEDQDVIVINKPAGLVVHPGNGNRHGTLVNALLYHCGDSLSGIGGVKRPGIVHRLDKNTTGVMVVAKNDKAHTHLSAQFADHGKTGVLARYYHALIWGQTDRETGTIDAHLGRSNSDRTRQSVVAETRSDARHAVTHFQLLEKFGARNNATALASLIACRLETGRTHQIRVHMAHIGHPIIGDYEYGAAFKTKANRLPTEIGDQVRAFPRQALHAHSLTFEHPSTGELMHFETPYPPDMQELLESFRQIA